MWLYRPLPILHVSLNSIIHSIDRRIRNRKLFNSIDIKCSSWIVLYKEYSASMLCIMNNTFNTCGNYLLLPEAGTVFGAYLLDY